MLCRMRRLFLISSSTVHGTGYLDHTEERLRAFLGSGVRRVTFVPYALFDRDAYAALVRERLGRMGLAVDSVHEAPGADGPARAVAGAEAVFVGGGNTFRLVTALHATGLVPALRERVAGGMPYVGSSAGTNAACPTLKTTNDMPIVEPPTFAALGLVPFQINPHYVDPEPGSTHMGETREQRIREFLEENDVPVLGLREGATLHVEGDRAELVGVKGAKLFRRGAAPRELEPGTRLDELLG